MNPFQISNRISIKDLSMWIQSFGSVQYQTYESALSLEKKQKYIYPKTLNNPKTE